MAAVHTEAILNKMNMPDLINKMNKPNLIDMVLKMQDNANATSSQIASLAEETKVLNSNFIRLKAVIALQEMQITNWLNKSEDRTILSDFCEMNKFEHSILKPTCFKGMKQVSQTTTR